MSGIQSEDLDNSIETPRTQVKPISDPEKIDEIGDIILSLSPNDEVLINDRKYPLRVRAEKPDVPNGDGCFLNGPQGGVYAVTVPTEGFRTFSGKYGKGHLYRVDSASTGGFSSEGALERIEVVGE